MPDDPRVRELLDELLDRDLSTPEEVCDACPELLPTVRERWQQICQARAEFDALLPVSSDGTDRAMRPEEPPLPQVPGYEVESVLGQGGMGVVFRARHLRLGRLVALKMTLAGSYAGPHERERFRREAEAIAALRHSNVVQIYDVGDWAGRPYFTMELIDGGSLAQRLTGAPLPARQAATLLATLAEAVHAAHQGGIVHRDLKPANILFAHDGTPKVTDFGLARRLEDGAGLTLSGAPVGTPSYMAPEQARGQSRAIGPAVDVYALGAILYELLTGRPPFRGETQAATILQVIDQEPVPPAWLNAKVHRDLQVVCLKCLQKEPARRYSSAVALGADLRRFLNGEAIEARPEGKLERLARRIRRRPGFSASVAIAVLLVAVSLSLAIERARADRRREADRVAMERAASDDLRDMVDGLEKKAWPQAKGALERVKGRLGEGDRGDPALRQSLEKGRLDLDMVAGLDKILVGMGTDAMNLASDSADQKYRNEFLAYGSGRTDETPEVVAARIRASSIRGALVDALDVWSVSMRVPKPGRKAWLLQVARLADRDQSDWVIRARDPQTRRDRKALHRLLETAPVDATFVPLLLAVAADLRSWGGDRVPFLTLIQEAHPGDYWANLNLAHELMTGERAGEAIRFAQAAVAIRPDNVVGYNSLGRALSRAGRSAEAIRAYQTDLRLDPGSDVSQCNFGMALAQCGKQAEAVALLREAVRLSPESGPLHYALGFSLASLTRNDEALSEFQRCLAVDPSNRDAQTSERLLLLHLGRRDEACAAWTRYIEADPQSRTAWDGYSEFCLFLGRLEEYQYARRQLLARFGEDAEFREAERLGRACLLAPATYAETKEATALIDRAISDVRTKPRTGFHPYFLFAKGLSEYRLNRFDNALAIMRGESSGVLGPSPHLVEAMALHRLGRRDEAMKALAAGIGRFDWQDAKADTRDAWMYHILRREAEELIGSSKAAKDKLAKQKGE